MHVDTKQCQLPLNMLARVVKLLNKFGESKKCVHVSFSYFDYSFGITIFDGM